MAFKLDPKLRNYATDRQWELLTTLEREGSERKAAAVLKCNRRLINQAHSAVLARASRAGYAPEYDMIHAAPDGFQLRGTSTLYRTETGEPVLQWVKTMPDQERQLAIMREIIAGMTEDLPKDEPLPAPTGHASEKLMACYPVGDHHLGMLSWDKETGADYDLTIGERLLKQATDHLVRTVPTCERSVIAFLGDFMHYDSFESVTPTSRNQLDADSRFPKMVQAAIRCMRYMIETALLHHQHVHVIVEIGNHDLSSSIFLMQCLSNIYANEPRITIDVSPMHFHYFTHGKVLVGTHHGHGVKMQQLPLIMATDRQAEWGACDHRYWWTGHIHHSKVQAATSAHDFSGCTVESFRVLAPTDAWAQQKGYRPIRDMKAIVLHSEYGEVARYTVNPAMF